MIVREQIVEYLFTLIVRPNLALAQALPQRECWYAGQHLIVRGVRGHDSDIRRTMYSTSFFRGDLQLQFEQDS